MRKVLPWTLLVWCLAYSAFALAQTPASDEQKRRLVEQKIKLVETLAASPAAKASAYGRESEMPSLVAKAGQSIEAARAALAAERIDDAAKLVDEALKAVTAASRRLNAGAVLSDSAQRKSLQDLAEQVETYRASLVDLSKDPKDGSQVKETLVRLDALVSQARLFENSGRLGEANRKMAEAYKLAVDDISRLRHGQEVVMSLKFDSPAEEYAYEQKRFASNEIIVDMVIAEGKAEGDRRPVIDRFIGQARQLKREAEAEANANRYKEAVGVMEKATAQLVRALQLMGVPVF